MYTFAQGERWELGRRSCEWVGCGAGKRWCDGGNALWEWMVLSWDFTLMSEQPACSTDTLCSRGSHKIEAMEEGSHSAPSTTPLSGVEMCSWPSAGCGALAGVGRVRVGRGGAGGVGAGGDGSAARAAASWASLAVWDLLAACWEGREGESNSVGCGGRVGGLEQVAWRVGEWREEKGGQKRDTRRGGGDRRGGK